MINKYISMEVLFYDLQFKRFRFKQLCNMGV